MDISPTSATQSLVQMINQLFDMEKKLAKTEQAKTVSRNFRRMKQILDDLGLSWHDPIGEYFDETRTDCEASISGESAENLVIIEVIKPIIRMNIDGFTQIIQRGVVIAESK